MLNIKIDGLIYNFDEVPDECPHCHRSIHVKVVGHFPYTNDEGEFMDMFYACPNGTCMKSFITTYQRGGNREFYFLSTSFGTPKRFKFSKEINEVSPSFAKIYNQAAYAEQRKLLDICGCGYRKSLEFLIKDYLISQNPNDKLKIQSQFLGNCIKEYIRDPRLLASCERATWLGNDETHYVRIWTGKNLTDLKKLVDLSIHWIEIELLSQSIEQEMPNKIGRNKV